MNTEEDLRPVDTQPVLSPVATITLDEEPAPAPGETQLLEPVPEGPPRGTKALPAQVLDVRANTASPQARKRAAMKSDAFESFGALDPARGDGALDGPERVGQARFAWTPGRVALVVMGLAVLVVLGLIIKL